MTDGPTPPAAALAPADPLAGDESVITAPWTDEQVVRLNEFQRAGRMHAYTCGNDDHDHHVDLVATTDGWVCPECDYRQRWAHACSAEPLPPSPFASFSWRTSAEQPPG